MPPPPRTEGAPPTSTPRGPTCPSRPQPPPGTDTWSPFLTGLAIALLIAVVLLSIITTQIEAAASVAKNDAAAQNRAAAAAEARAHKAETQLTIATECAVAFRSAATIWPMAASRILDAAEANKDAILALNNGNRATAAERIKDGTDALNSGNTLIGSANDALPDNAKDCPTDR